MIDEFGVPAVTIDLVGVGIWSDLQERGYQSGKIIAVTGIQDGMTSGKPIVTFRVELNDVFDRTNHKQTILAGTSLAHLLTLADALKAKYGDPRK